MQLGPFFAIIVCESSRFMYLNKCHHMNFIIPGPHLLFFFSQQTTSELKFIKQQHNIEAGKICQQRRSTWHNLAGVFVVQDVSLGQM